MGVIDSAERESWQVRRDEDGAAGAEPDAHGQVSANAASPLTEHLRLGADRADCTGGIPRGGIAGGILKQLIAQAEDQLREARACISWYQEAEEKAERQLSNLLELQRLAENDHQDN